MPSAYVPGKPNRHFPKHQFADIPVYRNIKPVSECPLHHTIDPAATIQKAVAVPILTPEHLWQTFQVEAEELIRVDGSMEARSQERNRRISAAYAKLWLADNRFQWAGLAAFASKQVGCGLLHAAATEAKNRSVREAVGLSFVAAFPGAEAAVGLQAGAEAGAAYMHAKLGFGNAHLFLDIYPLHRFSWSEAGRTSRIIFHIARRVESRSTGRSTTRSCRSGRRSRKYGKGSGISTRTVS